MFYEEGSAIVSGCLWCVAAGDGLAVFKGGEGQIAIMRVTVL